MHPTINTGIAGNPSKADWPQKAQNAQKQSRQILRLLRLLWPFLPVLGPSARPQYFAVFRG